MPSDEHWSDHINLRVAWSGLPVAIFWVLSRLGPAWLSISVSFIAAIIVFIKFSRRDRLIGALTLFGFVVVAASAVIGVVVDSEKAYLAAGPVSDFLFVALYLGSIAIRRPLIGGIAHELLPGIATRVPVTAPLFVWLTVSWAGYDLFHGLYRIWMLQNLSVGEYIIWSRVAGWPLSVAMITFSGWHVIREAQRRQPPAASLAPA